MPSPTRPPSPLAFGLIPLHRASTQEARLAGGGGQDKPPGMTHTKGRESCFRVSGLELERGGCHHSWKMVLPVRPLQGDNGTQRKEPPRKEASESIRRADVSKAVLRPLLFGGFRVNLEPLAYPANGLGARGKRNWGKDRTGKKRGGEGSFYSRTQVNSLCHLPPKFS